MAATAKSSEIGWVAWEAESSFAESADDTYTDRMQIRDATVDVSGLVRPMIDPGGTQQRINSRDPFRLGAFGTGTFVTTFELAGHGSTTAGSLTEPDLSLLLAQAIGASNWTQVGGALTAGTNDANTLTSTNTTLVTGGLLRVGALGDGRAEGQATVALDATSSYELGVDLPGSPDSGQNDNVYAMGVIYPSTESNLILTSNDSANNNTVRFVLVTENTAWVCRGCACTEVSITGLSPGEMPQIALTWSTVAWEPISVTHPSTVATDAKTPAVTANGSVFINTVGTTTRATVVPLETTLTVGQGMTMRMGPGGANTGQNVVGWVRTPAETRLTMVIEAEAQTTGPAYWLTASPTTKRHILITGNTVDGSAYALYFPACVQVNNPTQTATSGLNTYTLEFLCTTGATTTSDLTQAPWILGLG